MKDFEVHLRVEAKDREQLERLLDIALSAMGDCIWDEQIIDPDERRFEERIRYEENWNGMGEHFIFEGKYTDDDRWSLDSAFPVVNDNLHYTALTKVRELMRCGTPFRFESN